MFYTDQRFKIIQLTDIHLGEVPFNEEDLRTLGKIDETLAKERPDLICITGDLIWSEGVKQPERGYHALIKVINKYDYPVVVTYGNHDSEEGLNRSDLREIEKTITHLVDKKQAFIDSRNRECFTVELVADELLTNVLYVFDTGSMAPGEIPGYDFISREQIDWYEKTYHHYKNHHAETRDIALMHIPLPEYEQAAERITKGCFWEQNPRIAAPDLNTGLFARFVFNQHISFIFCGHDHDNNFEGVYLGINCVYGNVSGYNCYGDLPRGYRLITLKGPKIETCIKPYT